MSLFLFSAVGHPILQLLDLQLPDFKDILILRAEKRGKQVVLPLSQSLLGGMYFFECLRFSSKD